MQLEGARPLLWQGRTVPFATSGALRVAWDQHTAVIGMRTDSNKTSDVLPLTPGKAEMAR